jgi:hypothetical protein
MHEESRMAVKLDMANTFDRVEHNFLFKVMRKFGFSQNFMNWINSCIKSPWIAPLINGRPGPFFKTSRGLRKGCPHSPILYVLMEKSLNISLEWESASSNIPGLKIAQGVKRLNHSQFADDTIILSGASKILARRILRVLDTFLTVSGGSLNKEKSQIYTWNVSTGTKVGITQIMGFVITQDWKSFKYLGLHLYLKMLPGEFWHILLQKFRGKMESWGARWLNPAGRVVLIKSCPFGSPHVSILHPPRPKGNSSSNEPAHPQILMAGRGLKSQKTPPGKVGNGHPAEIQGRPGHPRPRNHQLGNGSQASVETNHRGQ